MRDLDDATLKWRLILSDDPAEIDRLETLLAGTQEEAVDEMVEATCWSDDLPHLVGHRGTPQRRLEALREIYRLESRPVPDYDNCRLTPIEYRLAEALMATFVFVPADADEERTLIAWAQDAEEVKAAGENAASIEAPLIAALNAVRPFVDEAEHRQIIDNALAAALHN